jgi:hypothetical protein
LNQAIKGESSLRPFFLVIMTDVAIQVKTIEPLKNSRYFFMTGGG